jgi:hypothetical protein
MDEAWRRVKFNHLKGANAARSVLAHTFSLWPDKASEILSVSLTVARDDPLRPMTFSHPPRCLLRTIEKYITANAASNTPPNIKIKVVTILQFPSVVTIMGIPS